MLSLAVGQARLWKFLIANKAGLTFDFLPANSFGRTLIKIIEIGHYWCGIVNLGGNAFFVKD